jgi:hypothetical protein
MPSLFTPNLNLPYPDESMPADVPADMEKLAVALDSGVPSTTDPRLAGNLKAANNLSELTTTRKAALKSLGVAFGSGSFTGNGQSHIQVTVPHGLGIAPSAYGGTPVFEGFTKVVSSNLTNFVLQFDLVSGAGAQGANVTWFAFVSGSTYYFNWWAFA